MATAAQDLGSSAKVRKARAPKVAEQTPEALADAPESSNGSAEPPHRGRRPGKMSASHKEAMAMGREEGRAVRAYLEALEQTRPHRGRPVTMEGLERRLAQIDRYLLHNHDPLARLGLMQQRMDTQREIEKLNVTHNLDDVEAAFIKAAPGYSRRKGISYAVWRSAGVDARVLKAAGIARTRNP